MHITLEFLGELSPESIPEISQILNQAVKDKKRFKLHIEQPGAFPSFQSAHTLWAGIGGDVEKLNTLWCTLHEELGKKGFVLQKAPFGPHITLLTRPKTNLSGLVSFPLSKTGSFTLSEVILFESKVEEGCRVYPHLYCARLKNSINSKHLEPHSKNT